MYMFGTYCRLGLHVSDSDFDVVRAARLKIAPYHRRDNEFRKERHRFYRVMLEHHRRARALYRDVMLGDIGAD